MMFLHAPSGDFKFSGRSFVRLFHKRMQDNNLAIHNGAIENAGNTFGRFQPQFKQAVTHCARVRHAQIRAVNFHALSVSNEARNKTCWQREDFGFNAIVVKSYSPLHMIIIANTLCNRHTKRILTMNFCVR